MFRVAYRSVLRADLGVAEIESLIRSSAEYNARMGVTSAFLMNEKRCLHALEGSPKVIRSILESIWDDRRNEEFAILDIAYGEAALFPDWTLKVVTAETIAEEPELQEHPGVNWLANLDGGLHNYFQAPPGGSGE